MEETTNNELNEKQKKFCEEYVFDWNATRAYQEAYPDSSYDSANANGSRMLVKDSIQAHIKEIQENIAKLAGISQLSQVLELKKLAYSNIAGLFDDWISLEDYSNLTEEQKSAILEISYNTKTTITDHGKHVETDFVKVKMHDKMAAIREINKMLGFHAPEKKDITTNNSILQVELTRTNNTPITKESDLSFDDD